VTGGDALRSRLEPLLRACVQCGLCLPHCATYLATGDETHSPRGRLLLLGDALAADAAPAPAAADAMARCLGCRACETACPSGVTADLLEAAQAMGRAAGAVGAPLAHRITPERMPLLGRVGTLAETAVRGLAGPDWRLRLDQGPLASPARLLGSRPASPASDAALVALLDGLTGRATPRDARLPSPDRDRGPATLFPGCANRGLLGPAQRRTADLLTALGWRVETPVADQCCGALDAHAGRPQAAADRRRALPTPAGPWVVEAAGCGLELVRSDHPAGGAVADAAELLAASPPRFRREVSLRVVYHDPCHALHGRGIHAAPRALLDAVPGLVRLEPEEADVCCGSGGGYALAYPELSQAMGRRKAAHLAATGAQLVVTSNPGCLGQIRDALLAAGDHRPVLPLTDLLWYALLEPRR